MLLYLDLPKSFLIFVILFYKNNLKVKTIPRVVSLSIFALEQYGILRK
jgi:hypothetical protein